MVLVCFGNLKFAPTDHPEVGELQIQHTSALICKAGLTVSSRFRTIRSSVANGTLCRALCENGFRGRRFVFEPQLRSLRTLPPARSPEPWLEAEADRGGSAHLVDTTMLFAPRSGGVKRYLLAKRAWFAAQRPGVRHSLV